MATALWDGIRLRCPTCRKGKIAHKFFGPDAVCSICHTDYEAAPGSFTGAIIIVQFVMGILAIPVYIALTAWTPWSFTWRAIATVVLLTVGLSVFYRNVKGMWYGWLFSLGGH